MKSFQMKALALAALGLGGLVMAGSAAVACPAGASTANGGAWSAQFNSSDATLAISTPGMAGTSCALSLSVGASSSSRATVTDNSPNNEQRYRVRFYLDVSNLVAGGNWTLSNQAVTVNRVNDTNSPAQFSSDQLVVRINGNGSAPQIRFLVSDANFASGKQAIVVPLPPSANNQYRIEYDLQIGTGSTGSGTTQCQTMPATGGCFRYWVNAASDPSGTDAAPLGSITVNNSGWSGAKTAFLGMSTASYSYGNTVSTPGNNAGTVVVFDEFDSRRQTFIGQ